MTESICAYHVDFWGLGLDVHDYLDVSVKDCSAEDADLSMNILRLLSLGGYCKVNFFYRLFLSRPLSGELTVLCLLLSVMVSDCYRLSDSGFWITVVARFC